MKEPLLSNTFNPLYSQISTPTTNTVTPSPESCEVEIEEDKRHTYHINTIGCPKETLNNEFRVAQSPETVRMLVRKGYIVYVEKDAGFSAKFPNHLYEAAGAKIVNKEEAFACDVILKLRCPTENELELIKPGTLLYSFVYPAQNVSIVEKIVKKNIICFALDCIPRISRAQVFDALSSMANIAGYKAVIEAAQYYGGSLGGQMTAAGRVSPAKVLVIGGGVAGLSAIATAKNMGAIVRCFDTRPAVKEQVESLGGEFLEVKGVQLGEGTGGYAKVMTKEFIEAEMAIFASQAKEVDIIITTALIPGKPAPKLISEEMINSMKHGSVVVDLAAEMGGNIETTRKDEVYISDNGITHIGYTDLPSRIPTQASKLYSNNVTKLFLSMVEKNSTDVFIDFNDYVTRGCIISEQGELLWPSPQRIYNSNNNENKNNIINIKKKDVKKKNSFKSALLSALGITICLLILLLCNIITSDKLILGMITTFCLAGSAGYQAVWGVVPALHTPLMSVTNAISGITVVGGLLLVGPYSLLSQIFAGIAILTSCINISGGFLVTKRMVDMFRRVDDPLEYNYLYIIPFLSLVIAYYSAKIYHIAHIETMAYLASSLCCISSIGGLATLKTARFGNVMGMIGVFSGFLITLGYIHISLSSFILISVTMTLGLLIGYIVGSKVKVTDLPQTVAAFHSFVGLAAMVTSIAHFCQETEDTKNLSSSLASVLGNLIGGITLTGSFVAFGKLHGIFKSKPLNLRGKNKINSLLIIIQFILITFFIYPELFNFQTSFKLGISLLISISIIAMFLGWHLVGSVGGGDMPVCVTVLNSYSGWALVAEGFMFRNSLLIIIGSLIGFSGGILSYIMCVAMNRSLLNVLFGGYDITITKKIKENKNHKETTTEEAVELLVNAKKVCIIPGYGMAVAKAQYAVAELARMCRNKNKTVLFAIHPVAGRMPGQMNVLLAEAGVPYDWVVEMDEFNNNSKDFDVALVIGANDITNSAAEEDPDCIISGMPVLHVWEASNCIFMKRSMGSGYADLDNPVFFKENTLMLLGDAKQMVEALNIKFKSYWEA